MLMLWSDTINCLTPPLGLVKKKGKKQKKTPKHGVFGSANFNISSRLTSFFMFEHSILFFYLRSFVRVKIAAKNMSIIGDFKRLYDLAHFAGKFRYRAVQLFWKPMLKAWRGGW